MGEGAGCRVRPRSRGADAREAYFFASGQACCSTVGNASAAGMVFTIS